MLDHWGVESTADVDIMPCRLVMELLVDSDIAAECPSHWAMAQQVRNEAGSSPEG